MKVLDLRRVLLVARHELRLLSREWLGWGAVLVLALATGYGLWTGFQFAAFQAEVIEGGQAREARVFDDLEEQARQMEARGDTASVSAFALHPGYIGLFYPRFAALPPVPTAPLSIGQADIRPYYFWVTAERRDSFLDQEELQNPTHLLAGRFDLGFALVVVLPIVLIALAYDLMVGERSRGTLPVLMSQPISPSTLVTGKILARLLLVLVPTVGMVLSVMAVQGVFATDPWGVAFWCVGLVAYAVLWLLLCALVNHSARDASSNAVLLVGIWILVTLLLPPALNRAVAEAHPLPPRAELIQTTRELETLVRVNPGLLVERHYEATPELRPADFDPDRYNFPLFWMAIQGEVDRGMDPILSRESEAMQAQERLGRLLAVLSPPALLHQISGEIAGTGLRRSRLFMESVFEFHREHRSFFEPRTYAHATLRADEYQEMPGFSAHRAELKPSLGEVVRPLAALLAWAVGLGGLVLVRGRSLRSLG
jgi:ABC-2 type transport system permease protein